MKTKKNQSHRRYLGFCAGITGTAALAVPQIGEASEVCRAPEYEDLRQDVGIIPDASGHCPVGSEKIHFRTDDEDFLNDNESCGWTGAIEQNVSGTSTDFTFCRVDGRHFGQLTEDYGSSSQTPFSYAVLKLDDNCPDGATEFYRYISNEDNNNANHSWGDICPNESERGGSTPYTLFEFCGFRGNDDSIERKHMMAEFPDFGVPYGVFANGYEDHTPAYEWCENPLSAKMPFLDLGVVFLDDENRNHDQSYTSDTHDGHQWKNIVHHYNSSRNINSAFATAKVSNGSKCKQNYAVTIRSNGGLAWTEDDLVSGNRWDSGQGAWIYEGGAAFESTTGQTNPCSLTTGEGAFTTFGIDHDREEGKPDNGVEGALFFTGEFWGRIFKFYVTADRPFYAHRNSRIVAGSDRTYVVGAPLHISNDETTRYPGLSERGLLEIDFTASGGTQLNVWQPPADVMISPQSLTRGFDTTTAPVVGIGKQMGARGGHGTQNPKTHIFYFKRNSSGDLQYNIIHDTANLVDWDSDIELGSDGKVYAISRDRRGFVQISMNSNGSTSVRKVLTWGSNTISPGTMIPGHHGGTPVYAISSQSSGGRIVGVWNNAGTPNYFELGQTGNLNPNSTPALSGSGNGVFALGQDGKFYHALWNGGWEVDQISHWGGSIDPYSLRKGESSNTAIYGMTQSGRAFTLWGGHGNYQFGMFPTN